MTRFDYIWQHKENQDANFRSELRSSSGNSERVREWRGRGREGRRRRGKEAKLEREVVRGRERRERLNGEEPFRVPPGAGLRAHFRREFAVVVADG